jgi:hypothetical protein
MYNTPNETGWFWAKLTDPVDMPEGENWTSVEWEIVHVFDNNGEGDDAYRVSVTGVSPSQPRDSFVWGPRVSDFNKFTAI